MTSFKRDWSKLTLICSMPNNSLSSSIWCRIYAKTRSLTRYSLSKSSIFMSSNLTLPCGGNSYGSNKLPNPSMYYSSTLDVLLFDNDFLLFWPLSMISAFVKISRQESRYPDFLQIPVGFTVIWALTFYLTCRRFPWVLIIERAIITRFESVLFYFYFYFSTQFLIILAWMGSRPNLFNFRISSSMIIHLPFSSFLIMPFLVRISMHFLSL